MKPRLIEGLVIDEQGKPVAGAYVTIQAATTDTPDIAGVTSPKGKFKLPLPKGDFSLVACTRTGKSGMTTLSKFNHFKFLPVIRLNS